MELHNKRVQQDRTRKEKAEYFRWLVEEDIAFCNFLRKEKFYSEVTPGSLYVQGLVFKAGLIFSTICIYFKMISCYV